MIRYECDEGKTKLDAYGSVDELSADVALLICLLNERINKTVDAKVGNAFWLGLVDAINHVLTAADSPYSKNNKEDD